MEDLWTCLNFNHHHKQGRKSKECKRLWGQDQNSSWLGSFPEERNKEGDLIPQQTESQDKTGWTYAPPALMLRDKCETLNIRNIGPFRGITEEIIKLQNGAMIKRPDFSIWQFVSLVVAMGFFFFLFSLSLSLCVCGCVCVWGQI
jgi:hypothetical protein